MLSLTVCQKVAQLQWLCLLHVQDTSVADSAVAMYLTVVCF